MATILVRADAKQEVPPEEATVSLALGFEGGDKNSVHSKTVQLVEGIQSEVNQLKAAESTPVTKSSFGQLSTRSWRPYNKEQERLPLVYAETVSARVTFKDFKALGDWLAQLATYGGVSVRNIQWGITDETRDKVGGEVRTAAIKQSQVKAQSYADASGLTLGKVVSIADEGLLQALPVRAGYGSVDGLAQLSRSNAKSVEAGYDLSPEDITVAARVEASFAAE